MGRCSGVGWWMINGDGLVMIVKRYWWRLGQIVVVMVYECDVETEVE